MWRSVEGAYKISLGLEAPIPLHSFSFHAFAFKLQVQLSQLSLNEEPKDEAIGSIFDALCTIRRSVRPARQRGLQRVTWVR